MSVNRIFGANSVTGTSAGALNDISRVAITDGDIAVAKDNTLDSIHFYRYDSVSTEVADVYPTIIRPADVVGSGVWYMISPQYFMENLIVDASSKMFINEIVGNGSGLSLGYQDGTIDIVVGTTDITITKDMTTDSQITSTVADGTAPFVVTSTTLVDNLNAKFFDSQPIENVSLLDDNTYKYSVLPQVTDAVTVYPTLPVDFVTVQFIQDVIAGIGSVTISHGDLDDLLVDDHTQYILADSSRVFNNTSYFPRVSDNTILPNALGHLTTKRYVDETITALGLGASGNYLLRSGTLTATGILRYNAGVTPVGANDITDVEFVTNAIATHAGGVDPHTEYLLADATRETTARLHTDVGDSLAITAQTDYTYIVRSDIDFWLQNAYTTSGLLSQDFYTDASGVDYLSNIVRRDYPKSLADYSTGNVEASVNNLVTYGFLYEKLGKFLKVSEVIGSVVDVTITNIGTGGFILGTNNIYNTTPITGTGTGLTVRAFADENGEITHVTVESDGSGYAALDTVNIDGGNNDTIIRIDTVFSEGALHGDLGELNLDQHPLYMTTAPSTYSRAFTQPVSGVSSTSTGGDQDGELATRLWVQAYTAGGGPGSLGHDADLLNVDTSTGHDYYMYSDPKATYHPNIARGFRSVPFLDPTDIPDPANAPSADGDLVTVAWVNDNIGGNFVKADGSVAFINNQIYTPQVPHDYFVDKSDSNNLINKDYVDTYVGLALVSDDDEYMGYLAESFVSNNETPTLINDGGLTAVELNIDSTLKGTLSRVLINTGDGTLVNYFSFNGNNYPQTNPTYTDGISSPVNVTESYIILHSNEINNGTGAGLIITVATLGGGDGIASVTVVEGGYGFTNNDLVALDYVGGTGGTGSGAILNIGTVGTKGEVIQANITINTPGANYVVSDELVCPNASAPISVVRGDVFGFTITGSTTPADGVYPFEVGGDGSNSEWTLTISSAGTVFQFDQTTVGSGYTNTGTQQLITEANLPTWVSGSISFYPFISGEVIDVEVDEAGWGYNTGTYNYTDAGLANFTEGGYNVGTLSSNLDLSYINPLDEKIEVMHYNKGELDSNVTPAINPYVITAGNTISSISFDDWGHITDIEQTGVAAMVWEAVDAATFTVEFNKGYFVDTSDATGQATQIRLPLATPTIGQTIVIDDYWANAATNNITIRDNAGAATVTIEGQTNQDFVIDISSTRIIMTYVDSTFGWNVKVF